MVSERRIVRAMRELKHRMIAHGWKISPAEETTDEYEYRVRTTVVLRTLNGETRTHNSEPMDEKTARYLMADKMRDTHRELQRRRKAGPWEEIEQ